MGRKSLRTAHSRLTPLDLTMNDSCDARERDQALVEQLRQQQLELAKAPVVETPASAPEADAEETPAPPEQTEDAALTASQQERVTRVVSVVAEGEGGDLPLGKGTGRAEAEVPEATTRTPEVAADGQSATLSEQDATQDSEESRKRRESMRNNAEQVCN